ncbi:MAG: fibronectin type III domain-containing protein [Anaerolineae bacterium]
MTPSEEDTKPAGRWPLRLLLALALLCVVVCLPTLTLSAQAQGPGATPTPTDTPTPMDTPTPTDTPMPTATFPVYATLPPLPTATPLPPANSVVVPDTSPPLSGIPPEVPTGQPPAITEIENPPPMPTTMPRPNAKPGGRGQGKTPDVHWQSPTFIDAMPTPAVNWDGTTNTNTSMPADVAGAVGPNHFFQLVNVHLQIFNRAGVSLYGPANTSTIWTGFGGQCQAANNGDGVVLYDAQANRWLLAQFVTQPTPYGVCIAVTATGDPLGSWYRYFFPLTNGATQVYDYPKFAIWPDGYYLTANRFDGPTMTTFYGPAVIAFNRQQMLNGQAASYQEVDLGTNYGTILPADMDGLTQPPTASPAFFVEKSYDGFGTPILHVFKYRVDWATPANSTFTGPTTLSIPALAAPCNAATSCVDQPGTTMKLDVLLDRPMYRLSYRNYYDHEALLVVLNGGVTAASSQAAFQWIELRNPNTTLTVYQSGVYAPDSSVSRWMPSIAQDRAGNIAVAYSASNGSTVYPGLRYAGRLSTDTLNQLPQAETTLVAGAGSQTYSSRWGDYQMMTLDPTDDCTFWFTGQYYKATTPPGIPPGYGANWVTRVGAFQFPGCATAAASSVPQSAATTPGNQNVRLTWSAPPTNNGSPLSSYRIYRGVSSGGETFLASVGAGVTSYTDSAVNTGTTYYYTITAINGLGESGQSGEALGAPNTAPGAPQNPSAVGGAQSMALSWQAPAPNGGAPVTGYNIYRGTTSGSQTFLTSVGNVPSYTDTGLAFATTYYYKVTAVNNIGEGPASNVFAGTTAPPPPPSAPQNLAATAGNAQVALGWQAPASNGGSPVTNYRVYRGTDSLNLALLTTMGNVLSYTDNSVTNNTTYYYQVTAVNAGGEGPVSNQAPALPTAPPVPSAPQNLTAAAGNAQVALGWQAPASNGGSPISNYKVYRGTASNNLTLLTTLGAGLSYTDISVTNGTTYFYQVTAVNSGGEGAASNQAPALPFTPVPPGSPQTVVATAGYLQNALTWAAPASSGTGTITNYKIYRGTASNNMPLLTTVGTITSYTDTGLGGGTTYYYQISAMSNAGEGAKSTTVSARPLTPAKPGAPQVFAVAPANGGASLTWAAPASDGGAAITSYKVYRGTSSNSQSLVATLGNVLTYSDSGLTNKTTYYYKVTAVNSVGEGTATGVVSVVPGLPTVPLSFAVQPGNTQVTLTWAAPTYNGGAALTNYKIYDGTTSSPTTLVATVSSSVTSYTVGALTNGKTYYFKVTAVNSVGEGPATAVLSAAPSAPAPPGQPTGLAATAGVSQVSLSWTAPSSGTSPITNYKVYRGTSSTSQSLLTTIGNLTSYADATAANGVTYYYKVSAVNAVGEGTASTVGQATPGRPSAPRSLVATQNPSKGVNLSWTAPASIGASAITGYKVYRSTTAGAEAFLVQPSGTATTYTDTTTGANKKYYYKVSAVNAFGEGPLSNESYATAKDIPLGIGDDGALPTSSDDTIDTAPPDIAPVELPAIPSDNQK